MRYAMAALATGIVLLVAGCGRESSEAGRETTAPPADRAESVDKLKAQAANTVDAAKAYADSKREEYAKSVEGSLGDMNSKIAELKQKAGAATADTKAALEEQLKDLESKRETVGKKLEELQTSTSQAWGDMRQGLDAALKDLAESYEKARARF